MVFDYLVNHWLNYISVTLCIKTALLYVFNIYVCVHLDVPGLTCSMRELSCGTGTLGRSMWDLVAHQGWALGPASGAWSFSHWTTKKSQYFDVVN